MRRTLPLQIAAATALIATACAAGSLWGTPQEPTPEIPPVVMTLRAATATLPAPPQPSPTPEPPTPDPVLPPTSTPEEVVILGGGTSDPPILYYSQSGDTMPAVAAHFSVAPEEIQAPAGASRTGLLDSGTLLIIPARLPENLSPAELLLPDSEVVYSPSARDFNAAEYIRAQDGYLASYRQWLGSTSWTTGIEAVERISLENSLNPRLILALIEYQGHWVSGNPTNLKESEYPLGYEDFYYRDLYRQLMWAAGVLAEGYYGWRAGTLTEVTFPDGSTLRLSPGLNAGSVAIMHFFSKVMNQAEWAQTIDPRIGFPSAYAGMFGDPWLRAQTIEPLFPPGLAQPELNLPFPPNQTWYLTGGPHSAWEKVGALAALDFAPQVEDSGCLRSDAWIASVGPGLVVRSSFGVVMVDMDLDGSELTGWNILYLHVAGEDRIAPGTRVEADSPIGHPSCEGGISTGTHLHIARKYNGEWILADGGIPFVMSGWTAVNGDRPYYGQLLKGEEVVTACPCGNADTKIIRVDD